MKNLCGIFILVLSYSNTLIACPVLNGKFLCEDLKSKEKSFEIITTDSVNKVLSVKTADEAQEKFQLEVGLKVLNPVLTLSTSLSNSGSLTLSGTHYSASCLTSTSIIIKTFTTNEMFDENGDIIARENSMSSVLIDDITASSYVKTTVLRIFGDEIISTEVCKKI